MNRHNLEITAQLIHEGIDLTLIAPHDHVNGDYQLFAITLTHKQTWIGCTGFQPLLLHETHKPEIPTSRSLLESVQASLELTDPTTSIVEPLLLTHIYFLLKCAV